MQKLAYNILNKSRQSSGNAIINRYSHITNNKILIMIDHRWKGQDHLQQFLEHLPSSTSCSHRQAPKETMKKRNMVVLVKILVKMLIMIEMTIGMKMMMMRWKKGRRFMIKIQTSPFFIDSSLSTQSQYCNLSTWRLESKYCNHFVTSDFEFEELFELRRFLWKYELDYLPRLSPPPPRCCY